MKNPYFEVTGTKNLLQLIVFVILIIISSQSCGNPDPDRRMCVAQKIMEQYPDSALLILDSIAFNELSSDNDRALFGMLYTQALDKNHLCPQNDTLISASVDYYSKKNHKLNQVISTYYLGRTYFNKQNYAQALVNFYKARELSIDNKYYFWAGMACRGISDIYNRTYNTAEELSFAEEEYEYIKNSGKQPYLNWALLDLCNAVYNSRNVEKSDSLSMLLLDSAILYKDQCLYIEALRIRMMTLIDKNQYDEAYPICLELCESDMADVSDSLHLCEMLIYKENTNDACNILKVTSDDNMQLKSFIRYKIAKRIKDHETALKEAESVDSLLNITLINALNHNKTSQLLDYIELTKQLDEAKIQVFQIKFWTVTIGFVVSLILFFCGGVYLYKKHRRSIAEKFFLAEQLQDDLRRAKKLNAKNSEMIQNLKEEKQGLQKQLKCDYETGIKKEEKLHNIIQGLLSSKYGLFEELSSISCKDSKTFEKKIASAVSTLIKDFSSADGKIVEMEKEVNFIYDNVISEFRKDLPNLKDADYMLFIFSIFKFSNSTIALLLKEERVLAVYNRKRRLKDKIRQLDDSKRDKYMKFLI